MVLLVSPAAAETMLRWKLKADQQLTVTCTQQTEVETSVNNKPRRASVDMAMELAWRVSEVDDAQVATIEQTISRLRMKTAAPDAEPISYDSDSLTKPIGAAREIAAGLAPLVGAKFIVKMDARGNIVAASATEETSAALEKLPEDSQLKPLLTAEGLTNLFRLGGQQLPEKAVSAGDTWPVESEIETPFGKLRQEGAYTYVGKTKSAAGELDQITLSAVAKLAAKPDAAVTLQGLEQTKSGEMLFDSAAGRAVSSETRLTSKSVRPFRDTQIQVRVSSVTKLEIGSK